MHPTHESSSAATGTESLSHRIDMLYSFVLQYHDYIYRPRDYGNGDPIKMIEVHTLSFIDQEPGITVSDLAQRLQRTKGTVSVGVSALESKGYIYRERDAGNARILHLYTTPSGAALSQMHLQYDEEHIHRTLAFLQQTCTQEELDHFQKVLERYLELLKQSNL